VAIVHDWFQGYHGSERVVETLRSDCFPGAAGVDIYTFSAEPEVLPAELAQAIVRQSRLARMPLLRQRGYAPGYWRYLLPYMPLYFEHLDLSAYDLVVSSSHACALAARGSNAVNICYCHTPMRYLWLADVDRRKTGLTGKVMDAFAPWLRRRDLRAASQVEHFVANSSIVAQRIRSIYGREARVIHPPVDVDSFDPTATKDRDHFLWVGRFVPYKRPELVLDAVRELDVKLTMVGVGPLAAELRARAPRNVEIREWVDRSALCSLFDHAGGFIHIGDEDFGIATVEALAAGTPVIGSASGGARDTIEDSVDGVLVREKTVDAIRGAVRMVREREWDPELLASRARRFSRGRFVAEIGRYVTEAWV
jgi:glycosyltransferase involved in cell wall biosynthesis